MKVESFPPISAERLRLAKAKLALAGLTVDEWAQANGFNPANAHAVLGGRRRAVRGESLKIAMALGLHDDPTSNLPPASPISGLSGGDSAGKDNRDALLHGEAAR